MTITAARSVVLLVLVLGAGTVAPVRAQQPPAQTPPPPAQTPGTPPPTTPPPGIPPVAPPSPPSPPPAGSQAVGPGPGPFALDVRYAMPSYNTGSAIADPLGFRTAQLPGRGWGLDIGAHVYPIRGKRISLGLGADMVRTSGKKAPDPEDETAANDPTLETKFSAFAPQVSLNFGSARGWSYIGGGLSWTRRTTGDVEATLVEGPRLRGIHYGGGARWFLGRHVAFTFDLRFYRIPEQPAEGTTIPFQPKTRLFMGSAGLSFK